MSTVSLELPFTITALKTKIETQIDFKKEIAN